MNQHDPSSTKKKSSSLEYAPVEKDQLREMARAHRRVNYVILFYLLQVPVFVGVLTATENTQWRAIPYVYLFCFGCYVSYSIYHLLKYFCSKITAIGVVFIALFIPLAALIALVICSQKTTELLRKNGIEVGLLGAKPDAI